MANRPPNDSPLLELKHEAVPGYLIAFIIAFAAMGIYLALILISSPGPAGVHGDPGDHRGKTTPGAH